MTSFYNLGYAYYLSAKKCQQAMRGYADNPSYQYPIPRSRAAAFKETRSFRITQLATGAAIILTVFIAIISMRKLKRQLTEIKSLNQLVDLKNMALQRANDELLVKIKENVRITNVLAHDLRSPICGINMLVQSTAKHISAGITRRFFTLQSIVAQYCLGLISNTLEGDAEDTILPLDSVKVYEMMQHILDDFNQQIEGKSLYVTLESTSIAFNTNYIRLKQIFAFGFVVVIGSSNSGDCVDIAFLQADDVPVILFKNSNVTVTEDARQKYSGLLPQTGLSRSAKYAILEQVITDAVRENREMYLFEDKYGIGMIALLYDPKFYFYYCI